jgi:DNA-binding transcriptional ArsR family regulator
MARAGAASDPFNAIGEPTPRAILECLAPGERSVGDIVDALNVAQPSVSKHLRVLLDVGLVELRHDGRHAFYRANPVRIRAVHEWTSRFERYWSRQLGRVKQRAEQT